MPCSDTGLQHAHSRLPIAAHNRCAHACMVHSDTQKLAVPSSILQALREQLQGPARHLATKRKAHVVFDAPLGAGVAAAAGPAANSCAPRFPQQPSRGTGAREAAEAWAQRQLASPAAPPLRLLGWGAGGEGGQVPHGFPRTTRIFELLAELEPPMPRALWFLRVIALNRTRWAPLDGRHGPPPWQGLPGRAGGRGCRKRDVRPCSMHSSAPACHGWT